MWPATKTRTLLEDSSFKITKTRVPNMSQICDSKLRQARQEQLILPGAQAWCSSRLEWPFPALPRCSKWSQLARAPPAIDLHPVLMPRATRATWWCSKQLMWSGFLSRLSIVDMDTSSSIFFINCSVLVENGKPVLWCFKLCDLPNVTFSCCAILVCGFNPS